jgi:hypothetical protein
MHLPSVVTVTAFLLSSATPSTNPDRQTQGETSQRNDVDGERDRTTAAQMGEAEFREREEPTAIRQVASALHVSQEQTEQLLAWEASFRLSTRAIWARPSDDNADERRRGRRIAGLRRELDRKEKKLLGDRYYEYVKTLAREMNRRRWLQDGQILPPSGNDIRAD